MEEVSLKNLQGVWNHAQFGYTIKVRGSHAEFGNGLKYELKEVANTIEMDGWRIKLAKSSTEEVVWQKKGENTLKWTFEDDLHEGLEDVGIDQKNVVTGKRRRGGADYAALNKQIDKEEGLMKSEREQKRKEEAALAKLLKKRKLTEQRKKEKVVHGDTDPESGNHAQSKKRYSTTEIKVIQAVLESKDSDNDKILEAIKKLQGAEMDVQTLKTTLIAKTLNPFRKSDAAEISRRAKTLFSSWKSLYKKAAKKAE
eukprot:jgi/Bigna1/146210/aug1.110_g20918